MGTSTSVNYGCTWKLRLVPYKFFDNRLSYQPERIGSMGLDWNWLTGQKRSQGRYMGAKKGSVAT